MRCNLDRTILEINNLSKKYQLKKKEIIALDNVSLSLKQGEVLGIVGESGSGKSTLGRIIAQIEEPTSGEIIFKGDNIFATDKKAAFAIRRQIQMVFQNPSSAISPKMSVAEFIAEGLINYKLMNKVQAQQEVIKLLEQVGLNQSYANKYASQVSGGELQRIVIARAISVKPQIIIFDEATSALDVLVRYNILKLLVKLKRELDVSYIFIGHNLAVVRLLSQRMMVMNQGKIVETLASSDFINTARNDYTKQLINAVLTVDDRKG